MRQNKCDILPFGVQANQCPRRLGYPASGVTIMESKGEVGRPMNSKKIITCAAILLGLLLGAPPAFATDELYLCGTVEDTNLASQLITINVASGGCRGPRTFKLAPAAAKALAFQAAGGRKCFFINSNRCQAGYTYTITNITAE